MRRVIYQELINLPNSIQKIIEKNQMKTFEEITNYKNSQKSKFSSKSRKKIFLDKRTEEKVEKDRVNDKERKSSLRLKRTVLQVINDKEKDRNRKKIYREKRTNEEIAKDREMDRRRKERYRIYQKESKKKTYFDAMNPEAEPLKVSQFGSVQCKNPKCLAFHFMEERVKGNDGKYLNINIKIIIYRKIQRNIQ